MFRELATNEVFLNIVSYSMGFFVLVIMSFTANLVLTPKVNRYLAILIHNICMIAINLCFSYTPLFLEIGVTTHFLYAAKAVVSTFFFLAYYFFMFKEKNADKIKAFVLYQIIVAVADVFYGFCVANFLDVDFVEAQYIPVMKIAVAFLEQAVVYIFAAFAYYILMKKIVLRLPTKVLVIFSAILVLNCLMILCICVTTAGTKNLLTKVVLLISPVFLLVLSYIMYKIMVQLGENEVVKEKLYWVENVKGMELEYYNKLQEKTNEVRKIRHDFKDNLETAKLLIKENSDESIEKASEIISAMEKSINATQLPVYSENIVVNAIVGAKVEESKRKGITVNASIDVPKDLNIESIDLNCVFLNLFNNAIEATEKLQNSEREIVLKATMKVGYLFVKTENKFDAVFTDSNGKIVTSKQDKENHGFGTSLIKEIAKKYDGSFETSIDNGNFIAMLKLKNN